MIRVLSATLLLLGMSMPASAKVLCPPGRFTLHPTDARAPALDGLELVLGEGKVAITGTCPAVKAGDFHRPSGKWLLRVRARWSRCGGRSFALRARFDLQDAAYCTRLEGALRLGNGRRIPVAADRIPECGNGLREVGEQCDEGVDTACCGLDCRIKPGCLVACDLRDFPCAADEICVHTCGAGGVCKPRSEVYCGGWPVCDCNQQVTYSNRCAAYEAGTGYLYAGPCRRPCSPHRPDDCSPIEFCTALSENDCAKWQAEIPGVSSGLCTQIPFSCEGTADAPVCGCDGRTYRNDCELQHARMAPSHRGACSSDRPLRATRRPRR